MSLRRWLPPVLAVVLLLVGWEVAVRALDVRSYLVPAPSEIWAAAVDTRAVLPGHLAATVQVALLGLVLGAAVGVALALPIAAVPAVRRTLQPLLVASQSVPAVVLAPLLVVWFGFGTLPRVLVVALVAFFPVVVSTAAGLVGADRDLLELVRSMGAGRWRLLWQVRIPSAVPAFFSGLRIAAAYAMFGAVIAEWIGANQGLGIYLLRSQRSFQTEQVFVAIVLIALVSVTLVAAVSLLGRLATPWVRSGAPDPIEEDL